MTKIEFTRDAERDLINVFLYGIVLFGPVQAEKYAKTLNAKIEMAANTRISERITVSSSVVFVGTRRCPTPCTIVPLKQVFSCSASCMGGWTRPVTWLDLMGNGPVQLIEDGHASPVGSGGQISSDLGRS